MQPTSVAMPPMGPRPTGVTVIGILGFVGAGLAALAGLMLIVGGGVFAAAFKSGPFAGLLAVLGVLVILLAGVSAFMSWGLLQGRSWAWWLAIVFQGVGIVLNVVTLLFGRFSAVLSIAIGGLIFWYLTTLPVQEWFRVRLGVPWAARP